MTTCGRLWLIWQRSSINQKVSGSTNPKCWSALEQDTSPLIFRDGWKCRERKSPCGANKNLFFFYLLLLKHTIILWVMCRQGGSCSHSLTFELLLLWTFGAVWQTERLYVESVQSSKVLHKKKVQHQQKQRNNTNIDFLSLGIRLKMMYGDNNNVIEYNNNHFIYRNANNI